MTKDLSVIITAHQEGILLHKTVLSILRSAKQLDEKGISYEIILSLDNADDSTKKCALNWADDPRFTVIQGSFGNPSDNRNHAVKKATASVVALIDGDDLITESWLLSAYNMLLKQRTPAIMRPAVHAQFGYEEKNITLWFMRDSSTKAADAIQMAYWNLWTNTLMTYKEILVKHPYRVPENGFGFEDYLFCADTRAADIAHLTVPDTALFYRRRAGSVSSEHVGTVLDYSDLFAIAFIKSLPLEAAAHRPRSPIQRVKTAARRAYRFAFDTAKRIGPINRLIAPSARTILYKNNLKKLPNWFIREWKKINDIENQLWPSRGEIAKIQFHPLSFDPYNNYLGTIYQKLCHSLSGDHLDYLFLAPAMSGRGGTEKLIANYIKALQKNHPNWKIGILSTQLLNDSARDYFQKLHVDMLDFASLTHGLGDYEKYIVWSRILIQSKVKRLHVVNDDYWYHWISKHQKLLINNHYNIYISLFMREYTHEKGRVLSFADPDLVAIWPTVTKVFADNQRVIDNALENNAFDAEKMVVHYQPQDITGLTPPRLIDSKKPIRVLWASRISHQKRPDILKKVAAKLGNNFIVDVYGIIEKKQYRSDYFNNSKVHYRGAFNGISSIPTANYDIYLYTSQTDGIPNILMEVAAAGLPIVASNIGGVSEFIRHNKTGVLVEMEDIDGYVNAILSLAKNPGQATEFVRETQKLIDSQHSWDEFTQKVARDIS